MTDTLHIVRAEYPADAQDSAVRISCLSLKLIEAQAVKKDARDTLKMRLEQNEDYNAADAIKCEIANSTQEQRNEAAELMKAARKAVAATREQRRLDEATQAVSAIKHRIESELSGAAQTLMPFMRMIEA